jgi:hypothetical protein
MSGWIYAVYHELGRDDDGLYQIKFGRSKHDPRRDSLDGRVRKLDLSVIALGLGPVKHAVEPFQVSDHSAFENALKRRLRLSGLIVASPGRRHLTEVCKMTIGDFAALVEQVKEEVGK